MKHKLQPCPFCGSEQNSDAGPIMYDYGRQDKIVRDKAGKVRKRVRIVHHVECSYCGASGPDSLLTWTGDETELTADMISKSETAAAFEWNKRQPINDRAYALVNKIIDVALQQIGRDEPQEQSGKKVVK